MTPRILIVEDDHRLAALVRDFLMATGDFEVSIESRGDRAPDRILDEQPDLVVLDIMLPGLDGLEVCRQIRADYPGPILMLSALDDEVDQVVGLELGADDYVPKPVSPRLLLARVRTLLRRVRPQETLAIKELDLGYLVVDPTRREARVKGQLVGLTTGEFDLLLLLASQAGQVVSREEAYQKVRGIEWDGMDRSIDLRVTRLRRKLGDDAKNPRWLKSVRGAGYLLVPGRKLAGGNDNA
ncbi:MAG: response regulator [Proteobacteria bacterium]|nr:response regulator [Pseudomonadota bacterium]